jgi:3-hydroxybutyryl-CoA dehydrogenase
VWGKVAVHARSTPGFIVNRIARPYYAETLALLQEQAATPAELDACLRAVGFRMGPCELMDLIGHDTNFSVTQSVYEANFYDKRFVPSLVQRELVDGGLLGRKTGRRASTPMPTLCPSLPPRCRRHLRPRACPHQRVRGGQRPRGPVDWRRP